jgi:hypothetical protein
MDSPTSFPDRRAIIQAWVSDISAATTESPPSRKRKRSRPALASMDMPNTTIPKRRRKERAIKGNGERKGKATVDNNHGEEVVEQEPQQQEDDLEQEDDMATPRPNRRSRSRTALRPTASFNTHSRRDEVAAKASPTGRSGRSKTKVLSLPSLGLDGTDAHTVLHPSSRPTYAAAISQAESQAESISAPASTTSLSTASTKSRSPVRNMSDLRMADRAIKRVPLAHFSQLPPDMHGLYKRVKECSDGMEVVPPGIKVGGLFSPRWWNLALTVHLRAGFD